MRLLGVLLGLCLWARSPSAQGVENVRFQQTEDDQVVITYDLIDPGQGQTFAVELWVSQDDGESFTIQPRSVGGDLGEGVKSGQSKRVVWNVLSDIRKLEGSGFVVKVVARSVSLGAGKGEVIRDFFLRLEKGDAASSSSDEKLFHQGLKAYKKSQYGKARDIFVDLVKRPLNQRSSAGQFMLSRTLFHLDEYERALQVAQRLEQKYPDSPLIPDAYLLAGDCCYALKRFAEGTLCYGRVLANDKAPLDLKAQAAERLAGLVKNNLITGQTVDRLRLEVGEDRLTEALLFGEARWYGRLGWKGQSKAAIQAYFSSFSDGIFKSISEPNMTLGEELFLVQPNFSPAEVSILPPPRVVYRLQIIAFKTEELARQRAATLQAMLGVPVRVVAQRDLFFVQAGEYSTAAEAEALYERLVALNPDYAEAYVIPRTERPRPPSTPSEAVAETSTSFSGWRVLIDQFLTYKEAEQLRQEASARLQRMDVEISFEAPWFRVEVGRFRNEAKAQELVELIQSCGYRNVLKVRENILVPQEKK